MGLLNEILEDVEVDESVQLNRIVSLLGNAPYNCKHPMLAVEMIKRRIRTGNTESITREDIIRWGNRS